MARKRRIAGSSPSAGRGSAAILAIGLFKLVKGLALVAIGFGLHHLLNRDVAQQVNHWVQILRVDPENRYVHRAMARMVNVSPKQLRALSAGTFFYAALLVTEGVGLLMRKHWAEYFTVISTGLLIPLELYELAKHVTAAKLVVLGINVVIVIYLAMRLRRGSVK